MCDFFSAITYRTHFRSAEVPAGALMSQASRKKAQNQAHCAIALPNLDLLVACGLGLRVIMARFSSLITYNKGAGPIKAPHGFVRLFICVRSV
jgi:hypothetical protein